MNGGKRCKFERLITVKAEGKKEMCATCKYAIKEISINDDNCPIILEKMTLNTFSHYTSMKEVITRECIYLPEAMEVYVAH